MKTSYVVRTSFLGYEIQQCIGCKPLLGKEALTVMLSIYSRVEAVIDDLNVLNSEFYCTEFIGG